MQTRPGNNGGELRSGNPGNSGGGRPSESLKGILGDVSEKAARQLLSKVDAETSAGDLCRIVDVSAKYTIGQKIVVEQAIADRIEALSQLTAEFIPEERFREWHSQAMSILLPSQDVPLTQGLESTDEQS